MGYQFGLEALDFFQYNLETSMGYCLKFFTDLPHQVY